MATSANATPQKKYGAFFGVYIPTILMVFGVIIFLKMGWIVGHMGPAGALTALTLSASIVMVTAWSIASIATNIHVGTGGVYYIISRTFGLQAGATIGVALYIRQTLSIAFCVIGFAISLKQFFPDIATSAIGLAALATLGLISYLSTDLSLKLQGVIFLSIIASLISFFLGEGIELTDAPLPQVEPISFWSGFALLFPAMTGIESGVALSGSLKNPSRDLPLGTFLGIGTAYFVYVAVILFLAAKVPLAILATDPLISQKVALFESLILVGIWGATLSSVLGGLVGAPRTLQALAEDRVVPSFFGKLSGKALEPRVASVVTFLLSGSFVYFGTIEQIAPLLTMACLISYSILNLAIAFEEFMSYPSWRPKVHMPGIIALGGAVTSWIAMLMIDAGAAMCTSVLLVALFFVMRRRKLSSDWDDLYQGILLFISRHVLYRLRYAKPSWRAWRPNLLVFTERPALGTQNLLHLAQAITERKGFLTIASILSMEGNSLHEVQKIGVKTEALLKEQQIEAFVQVLLAKNVPSGMKQMLLHYGLGPLVPDTILLGSFSTLEKGLQYGDVIRLADEMGKNVILINDTPPLQLKASQNHPVVIWWDRERYQAAELMLLLAYLVQKHAYWENNRIIVYASTEKESELEQINKTLGEYFKANRIEAEARIVLADDSIEAKVRILLDEALLSGLILISLEMPSQFNSLDAYAHYLLRMQSEAQKLPTTAFVMYGGKTNFSHILQSDVLDTLPHGKFTSQRE
jgi:amino acid transporter